MAAITNFAYKGRGRIWVGDSATGDLRELGQYQFCRNVGSRLKSKSLKTIGHARAATTRSSIDISDGALALTLHDLKPGQLCSCFLW